MQVLVDQRGAVADRRVEARRGGDPVELPMQVGEEPGLPGHRPRPAADLVEHRPPAKAFHDQIRTARIANLGDGKAARAGVDHDLCFSLGSN